MAEETRALGYICPDCGKPVYGERTRFALNAAAVGLVCGCGRSELTAEPAERTLRVTAPCGVCGGEHRAEVPMEQVLEGGGVGLACPETRQLCCYIGPPGRGLCGQRHHVRGPLRAQGHRRQGRRLLYLRGQGLRRGGPRHGGGPGVPGVRGPAAAAGGHGRGPGPAVLSVYADHPGKPVRGALV